MTTPPRRVLLDTDLGTDVDDAFALLYALRQPALQLEAVTTVAGNATLRGHLAKKLLQLAGAEHVPVITGLDRPLSRSSQSWLHGREGEGLLAPGETPALDGDRAPVYLVDRLLAEPGALDLVAIGPLTNLAVAYALEPRIAEAVRSVTLMGSHVFPSAASRARNCCEHNISADPAAARIVFEAPWPLTVVPLEQTMRVRFTPADRDNYASRDEPVFAPVVHMLDIWLQLRNITATPLHDPLALIALHRPDLLCWETLPLHVHTEPPWRGLVVATPEDKSRPGTRLAVDVDVDGAHELFMSV